MQIKTIIIAIIFLLTGFISAYLIFAVNEKEPVLSLTAKPSDTPLVSEKSVAVTNPFNAKDENRVDALRVDALENEIKVIKQTLQKFEQILLDVSTSTGKQDTLSRTIPANTRRFTSALNRRLYNLDNLIRNGIDPAIAEDIVRRKNSVELKRLELSDRAKRENYTDTQRYYDELKIINQQDVSLREELGDDDYDEYLFNSKQNNRIKISSVMLGSAAEQAGIESGDIVLSYDNNRMFSWRELKDATTEGQLGEYVTISVYRDSEIYSFSVPRGPLGLQLAATRLKP